MGVNIGRKGNALLSECKIYSTSNINDMYFHNGSIKMRVPDFFFLFAGQSNQHGQGIIDPAIDTSNDNIFQLTSAKFQVAKVPLENNGWPKNDKVGLHLNFCKRFIEDNPNKTVAIVLVAQSGTSFGAGYWNKGDSMYNAAIEAASKLIHMGSVLKGIIWHQGESDSTSSSGPNYQTNLVNFVTNLRADLPGDQSQVPFVCGTMADDYIYGDSVGNPSANRLQVNTVHRAINQLVDYSTFSDLCNLPTQGDNLHFNAIALRIAGNRLYRAFKTTRTTLQKTQAQSWSILKAYSIDGVDEHFKTDTVECLDEATSFTISLIIKWDSSATATKYLFYKWDGTTNKIGLTWVNSQLRFEIGTSTVMGTISSRSNRTHHIVMTYNGANAANSRAKLYLDGSNIGGTPSSAEPVSVPQSINGKPVFIAAREGGSVYHAASYIECSIWQSELTSANVTSLYNSGSFVNPSSIGRIKHSWRFGDNTNDTNLSIYDNAGNSDLTCVNIDQADIITL